MKRKEYLKPEMKVFQLQSKSQLLVGSTTRLTIYKNAEEVDEEEIL